MRLPQYRLSLTLVGLDKLERGLFHIHPFKSYSNELSLYMAYYDIAAEKIGELIKGHRMQNIPSHPRGRKKGNRGPIFHYLSREREREKLFDHFVCKNNFVEADPILLITFHKSIVRIIFVIVERAILKTVQFYHAGPKVCPGGDESNYCFLPFSFQSEGAQQILRESCRLKKDSPEICTSSDNRNPLGRSVRKTLCGWQKRKKNALYSPRWPLVTRTRFDRFTHVYSHEHDKQKTKGALSNFPTPYVLHSSARCFTSLYSVSCTEQYCREQH